MPKNWKLQSPIKWKKLSSTSGTSSQNIVVSTVESMLAPFQTSKNRYQAHADFLKMDPELNQAITRLSLLTAYSYKGPYVSVGKTLTEGERKFQKLAMKAAEELDLRSRFFACAKKLLRDGDYVYVVASADGSGVQQIQPLPASKLTIVGSAEQIGDQNAQIQSCGLYVLNELDETKRQVFPEEGKGQSVFHFSIDNESEEIYDILNRWTFGVFSLSPMDCLTNRLLWKQAILITDILWRYRNVPREVHELDTSMFTPDKFTGENYEAQVAAATLAAQNYLKQYATAISKKKVDQGFVVGSNVRKISYIEPSKTTYNAPNELTDQINDSIREGVGAYSVGQGTYATELVLASYVVLMPDHLAFKIKGHLLNILKIHLAKKYRVSERKLETLDIRQSLVLDILRGELVRQMAVAAATETLTPDELRADFMGKDPLTEEQKKEIVKYVSTGRTSPVQTSKDIAATAVSQTEVTEPITPQSRHDKQTT